MGAGGRRPLLLARDRHRGVEPAAEQAGADRPHGRAARWPQRQLMPPHQRLRAARRSALLVHRRPVSVNSGGALSCFLFHFCILLLSVKFMCSKWTQRLEFCALHNESIPNFRIYTSLSIMYPRNS
uniref:Uncharacterized protein n=1 Tax=Arundo donax TaxID=35708 RepID=A0A0A9CTQ5_ARUDO